MLLRKNVPSGQETGSEPALVGLDWWLRPEQEAVLAFIHTHPGCRLHHIGRQLPLHGHHLDLYVGELDVLGFIRMQKPPWHSWRRWIPASQRSGSRLFALKQAWPRYPDLADALHQIQARIEALQPRRGADPHGLCLSSNLALFSVRVEALLRDQSKRQTSKQMSDLLAIQAGRKAFLDLTAKLV